MKRLIVALGLLLWTTVTFAQSILPGFPPGLFQARPHLGGTAAPSTNRLLLVDGTSFMLQTDGTSKICLAGGC